MGRASGAESTETAARSERMLLVPCDPLHGRSADEHFAAEAEAARTLGFRIALLDHDALRAGELSAALRRLPAVGAATAVYRGWMLRADEYEALARCLAAHNVRLLTTAACYRRAHELPGWYPAFAGLTPASRWSDGVRDAEIAALLAEASGRYVVKDYVKSLKHDADALAGDAETIRSVVSRYITERAEELNGGIVLREFEQFEGQEVRTWWIDGACALVSAHPDTPEALPPAELSLTRIGRAVETLAVRFCTVDLVRRADGHWRVVEVGDGQVSDRPRSTTADAFVAATVGQLLVQA